MTTNWPDFAARHNLDGRLALLADKAPPTPGAERTHLWGLAVTGPGGTIADTLTTDGSYTPDPIAIILGRLTDGDHTPDELIEAATALGTAATLELLTPQ